MSDIHRWWVIIDFSNVLAELLFKIKCNN